MPNQYHMTENLRDYKLPVDLQGLVNTVISGIMALATRAANSNSDSNSLGGILILPSEGEMPQMTVNCLTNSNLPYNF